MNEPLFQKSSDEAIGKVLGGLRDAEAPAGLEQRVLRRVAELEAAGQASSWRPAWLAIPGRGRSLAYGLAVAAVIAGGVAVVAVRRPARTSLQAHTAPAAAPRTVEAALTVAVATNRVPALAAHPPARLAVTPRAQPVALDEDPETVRMRSDTLAVSHPAPPMPLTEQERLLLKIAHTGDPEELVALNPELRDRALAKGAADFRAFFPPPPPLVVER